MNGTLRLKCVMMLASLILCVSLGYTNVQAESTNIQDVCNQRYSQLTEYQDSGEWDKAYRAAKAVRSCSYQGSLSRERVEYTYVAEIQALAKMGHHEQVIARTAKIVEEGRVLERRDFLGFIFEQSALAANDLGKMEESLHFFNLALYDSSMRDLKAKVNLRRSLYLLQKRNREYEAARETIEEIKQLLDEHRSNVPVEERFVSHTMIAGYYYARLIPKIRQGAGALDTTRSDVSELWSQARLYHQKSRSILSEINLDEASRDDLVHSLRILDLDVARLLDRRGDVQRLLAEWRSEAREKGVPSRLLHSLATQARVEMDAEEYGKALHTIRALEGAARDYRLLSFLPRVLAYRVRVASHTGDRAVAQRALDDLARFEGSVPAELFREASGQYASVFRSNTAPTDVPNSILLCLALGIAGTLQYIAVARTQGEKKLIRALASPLIRFVKGGHWEIPAAILGKTAQQGASVSIDPSDVKPNAHVDTNPEREMRSGGDGFSLATDDAAWLRDVGITVQDVPEIDAPPEVDPATLEDLLHQSLDASTRIRCFGPDGTITSDMPLPTHVIEHATSDRFIGIELDDRLLIVYRYARPQHTMVKQDETGALRIVELDTPVTAVPIASIQKEA